MDEMLTEEQKQLRDSASRLCADFGGAKRARSLRDAGQEIDRDAWNAMRAAGWLASLVPEERGGLGLGLVELFLLIEPIGRQVLMVPMLEAAATAWLLGRTDNGSAALDKLLSGDNLIVPALQADGWDFRRASKSVPGKVDGKAMRVSGAIAGVPFAGSADAFLVRVETPRQALLCLVARDDPGCEISIARNVDGSTAGTIVLTDARIEERQIVARGETVKKLATQLADLLSLGAAIELLGLAESALAMTLEHIKTRKQFGHPLGSFQALQHRMVDGFVDLELDRALLHRICLAWDSGTAVPAMIAAAKARVSRSAADVMRGGLQLHGAIGYTDEHDIGIYFKRALVLASRYGNEFTQSDRFARLTAEEA
jgi:3-oxochol-4-en-24-oyl-CoA dehydrogenase